MEATGYAFGAFDLCAASVGAPHIRQRLYFVAHSGDDGLQGRIPRRQDQEWQAVDGSVGCDGSVDWVANTDGIDGPEVAKSHDAVGGQWPTIRGREQQSSGAGAVRGVCGGDNSTGSEGIGDYEGLAAVARPSPTNGHWRAADWLYCTDGKWRPVEPGAFPLAHGAPARVGRLRGYGNAIVAPLAQTFIEEAMRYIDA
jgi:DNA (cytosine-5)-methyltransferase 1